MTRTILSVGLCLVLAAACGKKDEGDKSAGADKATGAGDKGKAAGGDPPSGGACPPLEVTVDGQPLAGLAHGQAVTMESAGYTTHQVTVYNRADVPCEDALTGRHSVAEGEQSVRAFHGAYPGVGIDVHTELPTNGGDAIKLEKVTDKVGETMEICIRKKLEFTPVAGAYEGKKVTMVGKLAGAWCGVNKAD